MISLFSFVCSFIVDRLFAARLFYNFVTSGSSLSLTQWMEVEHDISENTISSKLEEIMKDIGDANIPTIDECLSGATILSLDSAASRCVIKARHAIKAVAYLQYDPEEVVNFFRVSFLASSFLLLGKPCRRTSRRTINCGYSNVFWWWNRNR
jgi:hypothetical protein